jgi:hypothetical protein
MIKLINLLEELSLSGHYGNRKIERGDILDIVLPKEAYGDYSTVETRQKLKATIEKELDSRLSKLESSDIDASKSADIGYKIIKPILISKDTKYPVTMTAEYTVYEKVEGKEIPKRDKEGKIIKKKSTGILYYGIISDNTFVTLMIENVKDDMDLEFKMRDHLKQKENKKNKPIKILTHPDFEYEIDIDELFGNKEKIKKEIPTEDSVEYSVRTDYRKNADFDHKTYGIGTIVNTSAGAGGKGDASGKLDWVEVDFGKPYSKGGQFFKTRKISPVFTKVYFDTQKKIDI